MTTLLTRAAPLDVVVSDGLWQRFHRRPAARIGLALAVLLAVTALVGPWLLPDPDLPDYTRQLAAPGPAHWLGTDQSGRDLLARTVSGAGTSLGAAVVVMALSAGVGLVLGTLAGVLGGIVDAVVSRVIDVLLGLPPLVITLALVGVLGPGFANLVLAIALTMWAQPARIARSIARGADERPDVIAARMAGIPPARAALSHVLPDAGLHVLVVATLGLADAVVSLAALSFLGMGAQPPTAEWGSMLATSRDTFAYAPWQLVGPATGLVLAVAAASLIGDALRDAADPEHTS